MWPNTHVRVAPPQSQFQTLFVPRLLAVPMGTADGDTEVSGALTMEEAFEAHAPNVLLVLQAGGPAAGAGCV